MRSLALIVTLVSAGSVLPAEPDTHWSLRPRTRPTVPAVRNPKFAIQTPVDAFILARLEKEGLSPAPEADRGTLIRRVTFDLTGLPPTPEEVDAFVKDTSPDAYEKLVDRLLASPHYGEQWGQHWLDVVRYAETEGFEYDRHRPGAWRYRDYVIDVVQPRQAVRPVRARAARRRRDRPRERRTVGSPPASTASARCAATPATRKSPSAATKC